MGWEDTLAFLLLLLLKTTFNSVYIFIGYVIEEHNNPPDFFLDVINGEANNTDEKNIGEMMNLLYYRCL